MHQLVRIVCLWVSSLLLSQTLSAQARHLQDVLYLENGWIIRGIITSPDSAPAVQILTEGHNVFVFDRTAIRHIGREDVRYLPHYTGEARRGVYGLAELGLSAGSSYGGWYYGSPVGFSLRGGAGYRFWPRLAVGASAGLNFYGSLPGPLLPLTAEVRSDWRRNLVTPFTYGQGGYALALYRPVGVDENGEEAPGQAWGGPLFEVGGGLKIRTRRAHAWTFSLGYLHQIARQAYTTWGGTYLRERFAFQRLTFRFGLMF